MSHRRVVLAKRPVGIPEPEHFALVDEPLMALNEGEICVQNLYLSVDPAQRGYLNDENNYVPPVAIGEVVRALAVGQIIASRTAAYTVGQYVYGWFGWQSHYQGAASAVLRVVDPAQISLSAAAGILGINGLTAWLALKELGPVVAGQTLLVTAAAGAVGSIVGQLGKLAGYRCVAVVGSDEKGQRCLEHYGYDAFVNYRQDLAQGLARACPDGVDAFFDNVAGPIADQVHEHMNLFGRILQCGTMAISSWVPAPQGPRHERNVLTRRLRIQGFVIFDHQARFDEAAAALTTLVESGQLRFAEDIQYGLEAAPAALGQVYRGLNQGKRLIKL